MTILHSWKGLAPLLALAAAPGLGLDGALDVSFQYDGEYLFAPIEDTSQPINAALVAPDGRLVVAGHRSASGAPTTSFWAVLDDVGAPSVCTITNPGGALSASVRAAAFDSSGRLVLAGSGSFPGDGDQGFALRVLYPGCDLDETFAVHGVYRSDLPSGNIRFGAVGFDSLDRVVLAGHDASNDDPLAVRLGGSDGNPDSTFDADGVRIVDLEIHADISSVAVQPDDRILLGGTEITEASVNVGFLVLRLDPEGGLDGTFSGDGRQVVLFGDGLHARSNAMLLDPETGKVVLAGWAWDDAAGQSPAAVARLTPAGQLDGSFSGDGRWLGGSYDYQQISALVRQGDGRILGVGRCKNDGDDFDFVAFAFTPAGELDPTFGFFGIRPVQIDAGGSLIDVAEAATLQHGKLVLAGKASTLSSSTTTGAIVRLESALIFADGLERGSTGAWSGRQP